VQNVSDLHPKFALRPQRVEVWQWQTSNLQPLRLGEERKKERKNKQQDENIYGLLYYMGDHKTAMSPPHVLTVVNFGLLAVEICWRV